MQGHLILNGINRSSLLINTGHGCYLHHQSQSCYSTHINKDSIYYALIG